MELRVLQPDQIYPHTTGGFLRTYNIARLASDYFKTSVFGVSESVECEKNVNNLRLVQEKKHENIINKLNYYYKSLFSENYNIWEPQTALIDFKEDYGIIQIEGPFFFNYLKKSNISNYILDEHNVYWEFNNFPFDMKYKIYNSLASKRNKKIEIDAIKGASNVLVCSERDKNEIIKEVPSAKEKITVIPNCVYLEEYESIKSFKTFEKEKPIVLFMGLLSYEPNADAVKNICELIAPKLVNEVDFLIIGKNAPQIKAPSNVKFLGYVEDIKSYVLNSDICIAPLRYGSGTRFKILEYMALKRPVISTSKGAEGINYTEGKNIIIEDKIEFFADRIIELLDSNSNLGNNGFKLIKDQYDWKLYQKPLINVYEEVLNK